MEVLMEEGRKGLNEHNCNLAHCCFLICRTSSTIRTIATTSNTAAQTPIPIPMSEQYINSHPMRQVVKI